MPSTFAFNNKMHITYPYFEVSYCLLHFFMLYYRQRIKSMDRNDFLKVVIDNARTLRGMYMELLCPFFNEKKIRQWRKMLYQLHIEEWIKDRIWEYLNGDIELEELILIYARSNKINDK